MSPVMALDGPYSALCSRARYAISVSTLKAAQPELPFPLPGLLLDTFSEQKHLLQTKMNAKATACEISSLQAVYRRVSRLALDQTFPSSKILIRHIHR